LKRRYRKSHVTLNDLGHLGYLKRSKFHTTQNSARVSCVYAYKKIEDRV